MTSASIQRPSSDRLRDSPITTVPSPHTDRVLVKSAVARHTRGKSGSAGVFVMVVLK